MSYPCFLVEERNEREIDGERRFDICRVDTGEVLVADARHIYRNQKTGEGVPVGAMWWTEWQQQQRPPRHAQDYDEYSEEELADLRERMRDHPDWHPQLGEDGLPVRQATYVFADGPCLNVMTPGGVWNIDSRASNCTLPYDYEHRCWVRHGEPPHITVDKDGHTCSAGAGSIQSGDYHGFLRDGELTD